MKDPIVVGFGGSGHDWSACLMRGDRVIAAVEEERISRRKYGIGAPLLDAGCLRTCLEEAGIEAAQVDHAVACDLVPLPLAARYRSRLVRIRHHLAHAYGAAYASP